jgi:positive phototaxis protein PixI
MSTTLSGTSPRASSIKPSDGSVKEQSQQFLSLHLSQQQAIVPTDSLIEVVTLSPSQIVPIPDTPDQVMGVCNWRGEVLWLIDAGYLVGDRASFTQTDYQTKFSVVVLQRQSQSLGLVVDRVGDMLWCLPTEIQGVAPESAQSRCLMGTWQLPDGQPFLVLDPDLILHLFA